MQHSKQARQVLKRVRARYDEDRYEIEYTGWVGGSVFLMLGHPPDLPLDLETLS